MAEENKKENKIEKKKQKKENMYSDSKKQWNLAVGCNFECIYCKYSFQAQMIRQKNRCLKCFSYEFHLHLERLNGKLPLTKGDEFIWVISSGDISNIDKESMEIILNKIENDTKRTFFMQSKNPEFFQNYQYPNNLILGITLETNRDKGYEQISKAPLPSKRVIDFCKVNHNRKSITIEPILDFDLDELLKMVKLINPERVYIGYNSKTRFKKLKLPEPSLKKTLELIEELRKITKVKLKSIREAII